jgi:DNA polymerase-3 subunit delta
MSKDKNSMLIADHLGSDLAKISNELDKIFILLPKGSEISDDFIEDHVGISKNYNVFELQDAIASRDLHKSYQIVKYFVDNPKKNPPVVVINGLFSFYSRLYKGVSFVNKNDGDLARELGFSPRNEYAAKFMVRNYRQALRTYKKHEIEDALITLSEYDLRSKGVNNVSFGGGDLLLELIYKLVTIKSLA